MIKVFEETTSAGRSIGRGALRIVLYACLIGLGSAVAGCGTPKETVNALLDDNALTDDQYEAMRARDPAKSRGALQDDWDAMTRAERERVMDEYRSAQMARFGQQTQDQMLRENMERLYGNPTGGEGGGGGGGGAH